MYILAGAKAKDRKRWDRNLVKGLYLILRRNLVLGMYKRCCCVLFLEGNGRMHIARRECFVHELTEFGQCHRYISEK